MIRLLPAFTGFLILFLAVPACSKKQDQQAQAGMPKPVSKLQAAEADNLASDALFALQIRDYARARTSLEKALDIRPDVADWWENMGVACKMLNKPGDARSAYKKACSLWESSYDKSGRIDFAMRQLVMLVLLNRNDEARSLLDRLAKKHPQDLPLQSFIKNKGLEQMLSDPNVQAKRL